MSNYFVVHPQSNTIVNVIASTQIPTNTETTSFVEASDGRLFQYYDRIKWHKPVDLYSIIPKPKIPDILPLSTDDRASLIEYVSKHQHRETIERMAWVWRVSERTIRGVLEDL
ncbi:hypothetical protein D3C84_885130 [compost metagenome]